MEKKGICVGIIGPTDIEATSQAAGLDPVTPAQRGYHLVLVPDRGVGLLAAQAYRAAGGPRLVGIIPHGTSAQ